MSASNGLVVTQTNEFEDLEYLEMSIDRSLASVTINIYCCCLLCCCC